MFTRFNVKRYVFTLFKMNFIETFDSRGESDPFPHLVIFRLYSDGKSKTVSPR